MPLIAPSPALAAQLHTAARDRRWIHHVDCATYAEDGERRDCDCGVPELLTALDALLGTGTATTVSRAQRAA